MRCTRMVRFLGMVALAAWLSGVAQAQHYHVVAYDDAGAENGEVSSLKSEVGEVREKLNTSTHDGYEGAAGGFAPACGCGCEQHCGCGDCCGCDTCGCDQCCGGGTCGCFEPCCHSTGLWAMGELMYFRYHRADGVRVGTQEPIDDVEFDFETTPRLTVGWVRDDGLGVRVRYWEFDHSQTAGEGEPSHLSVDTYTFDFELFDTFCLNRNWDLEIAAGVRYCDFVELMSSDDDLRLNSFNGFGIVTSAELRRCIGTNGTIWVRARTAILMDDKDIANLPDENQQVRLLDTTVGMTELAFGYDYVMPMCNGAYAFAGVQAEWQNWYNFSSGFEDTEIDDDFAGPADVGFGGFGFRAGVIR